MTLYGINLLIKGLNIRHMVLAGVAFCRSRWDRFIDPDARDIVNLCEEWADGDLNLKNIRYKQLELRRQYLTSKLNSPYFDTDIRRINELRACQASLTVIRATPVGLYDILSELNIPEWEDILRTFHSDIKISAQYKQKHIIQIAEAIYNDNEWESTAILGDALEETGCDNPDILDAIRSKQRKFRGFWVVDQLLEKV